MTPIANLLHRLRRDLRAVAMIEFAFALPILVVLSLTGAELTNYITAKMRISQIALQLADNAARMGSGTPTQAKQVTETDINDIFAGAQVQSGGLDLKTNGRAIISDLEVKTIGAPTYRIRWQRCYGDRVYPSTYGNSGDTNLTGMGPAGRQVTASDNSPTMFVEVNYLYKPLFANGWAPTAIITEIASMSVRDRRDTTQIYNSASAPVASC